MPKLSKNERTTIETFNQTVDLHEAAAARDYWMQERKELLSLMSTFISQNNVDKPKVLDIGSGVGSERNRFTSHQVEYHGIEPATGMIQRAKQRHSDGQFYQMFVQELGFADKSFDAIWAVSVLHHLQRSRIEDALTEINRVMRSGAVGFMNFFEGTTQRMIPTPGAAAYSALVTAYRKQEIERHLKRTNFTVHKIAREYPFLLFTVVKQKTSK